MQPARGSLYIQARCTIRDRRKLNRRARRSRELVSSVASLNSAFPHCLHRRAPHGPLKSAREARTQQRLRRAPRQARRPNDCPIVSLGLTGREILANLHLEQEENFYYLTVITKKAPGLVSSGKIGDSASPAPTRNLYLPRKIRRKKDGTAFGMSSAIPALKPATGFATVSPSGNPRRKSRIWQRPARSFYTILPYQKELGGFPHGKRGRWTGSSKSRRKSS